MIRSRIEIVYPGWVGFLVCKMTFIFSVVLWRICQRSIASTPLGCNKTHRQGSWSSLVCWRFQCHACVAGWKGMVSILYVQVEQTWTISWQPFSRMIIEIYKNVWVWVHIVTINPHKCTRHQLCAPLSVKWDDSSSGSGIQSCRNWLSRFCYQDGNTIKKI